MNAFPNTIDETINSGLFDCDISKHKSTYRFVVGGQVVCE